MIKKQINSILVGILIVMVGIFAFKNFAKKTVDKQESLSVAITEKKCENGHFTIYYEVENKGSKYIAGDAYRVVVTVNDGIEHFYNNNGVSVFGKSKQQAAMIIPDYFDCKSMVSIKIYPF